MQRNPDDPSTWLVELWWPQRWQDHFYAREFEFHRAFGLRLLKEPGPWQVTLVAPDPVVSYCDVAFHGVKVAELYIDPDVPDGTPWHYRVSLTGEEKEIHTPDLEEAVMFVVQAGKRKAVS